LSRNFHEQAKAFISFCETYGVILVAPTFTEEHHADYQRLGRLGRGQRADLFLHRCLEEVNSLTAVDITKFYIMGYSGGAQFAHRYLMAHPHRILHAAIVAAGWYTFPDTSLKFPYGIRSSRKLPKVVFNPEGFLRVPISVMVGDQDISLLGLRTTPELDEQQGNNRLQRAKNWVNAMHIAAEAYGFKPLVSYTEIPSVGHVFSEFCDNGALAERIFNTLFEQSPPQLEE